MSDYLQPEVKEHLAKPSILSLSSTKDKDSTALSMTVPPLSKASESDATNENSTNCQINKGAALAKVQSHGLVTPLLGNGLKKTFVRCRNNMFTIVEEPRDNSNALPASPMARNSLDSPKKQVNIEQLRLGFSADSRSLFALKREDPSDVGSSHPVVWQAAQSSHEQGSTA